MEKSPAAMANVSKLLIIGAKSKMRMDFFSFRTNRKGF